MFPTEILETYRLLEFALIYGLLVCLAVARAIWMRVAFVVISRLVRFLHARGILRFDRGDPEPGDASMPEFDRTFISVSGLLERTCRLIPGDPNRHAHPIVLALLLVGVPLFLGLVVLTFVIPFLLFSYVTLTTSIAVGLLSLLGYVGVLLALNRILRRVPRTYRRLRRRASERFRARLDAG